MKQPEYPKIYLYQRIVQAKLFIDKKFDQPLDLNMVSDEAAFSKFHFIRLFKKIYGMTPNIYLRTVRIDRAKDLLEKRLSVIDVCGKVGFESIGTFTTMFKKNTGLTPSAYQLKRIHHLKEVASRPIQFVPNCFATANGWKEKQF